MLGFTGSFLDRAETLRHDEAAIIAARADPRARFLLLAALKPAMDVSGPVPLLGWVDMSAVPDPETAILLGLENGEPRFAAPGPAPAPTRARAFSCSMRSNP